MISGASASAATNADPGLWWKPDWIAAHPNNALMRIWVEWLLPASAGRAGTARAMW